MLIPCDKQLTPRTKEWCLEEADDVAYSYRGCGQDGVVGNLGESLQRLPSAGYAECSPSRGEALEVPGMDGSVVRVPRTAPL